MQNTKEKIKSHSKISKQAHIKEEINGNGEVQYNCTACGKTFRSRSQRYYHINCNELQNLTYKCEHCDKSFARLSQWKYHIKSHITPISECLKCKKTFSNPLALKKHEALHEVEPKSCPHCDKTFKKKISLDQHIAAQHLKQLEYGCAYCNKKYASKSTLQLHLQSHEKKRFECTFCGKLFQRNSILNLHLKRHYKTNSYVCVICQKVFSESGALTRHRKIHEEGAPQYYCKICDKAILRKDNMRRHLITMHPEEKFENVVKILTLTTNTDLSVNVENKEHDLYKSKEECITKSNQKCLIIENKLLYIPSDLNKSVTNIHKNCETKIDSAEYAPKNQIKVITAVSTYRKQISTDNIRNIAQENSNQQKNINDQNQDHSISLLNPEDSHKNDSHVLENNIVKESRNNTEIPFVDYNPSHNKKCNHIDPQEFSDAHKNKLIAFDISNTNPQQSAENYEPPLTQTLSSVIRSVGNVKKNLNPRIDTLATSINITSPEYKHKKYCRNYYNIDLYRKILGCDGDEDMEKQQKFENMLKSSTPLHWRKCFKNNYETSGF